MTKTASHLTAIVAAALLTLVTFQQAVAVPGAMPAAAVVLA